MTLEFLDDSKVNISLADLKEISYDNVSKQASIQATNGMCVKFSCPMSQFLEMSKQFVAEEGTSNG